MIYLRANAALMPIDISRLELEEFNEDLTWLRQARRKTGIDRAAALWPETTEALKAAIAGRTKPADPRERGARVSDRARQPGCENHDVAQSREDQKGGTVGNDDRSSDERFSRLAEGIEDLPNGRGCTALRHGFLTIAESGNALLTGPLTVFARLPPIRMRRVRRNED